MVIIKVGSWERMNIAERGSMVNNESSRDLKNENVIFHEQNAD